MSAFAIAFSTSPRVYLGHAKAPRQPQRGWRPFRWVRDAQLAELFSSRESARQFGLEALQHDDFKVVFVPPQNRPTNPNRPGGTPVAISATG